MKIRKTLIIIFILCSLSSCKHKQNTNKSIETTEKIISDLQVDHLNIWVKNPKKAKERLTQIGFTAEPDSLSTVHKGQGTSGKYFYFLNSYLELIFVYDQTELEENNAKNKGLDFTERASFEQNGASPFSIALKVKDDKTEKIPFEKIAYHQDWMEENANIYAAKNSKINLKEPSIFVVYPEIYSPTFESLSALQKTPSDNDFWKEFFIHKNGAKKISNIRITSTDLDLNTETIKAINSIKNMTIKKGKAHLMELYFDNNVQGKSFDLRPELPLIIHL